MVTTTSRNCCFLLALAVFSAGCHRGEQAAGGPGGGGGGGKKGGFGRDVPTSVLIAQAVQKNVPVQAEVIGTIEPYSTVTLKAQVSGQIMDAHFQDGDFVNKGQLLMTIDPRIMEAQAKQLEAAILKDQAALSQAEANLIRDRAQEANSRGQAERAAQLWKEGIVSKEQYDQLASTAAGSAAVLKADEAAIQNSNAQIGASKAALDTQRVQIGYTKIYAPISGRTGTLMVKPGNIVQANTTELATINQMQPVYVSFSLPENLLPILRRHNGEKLTVLANSEDGGIKEQGVLSFFENTVDTTTGTIRLKATFQNPNKTLWPGQFVRVILKLEDRPNAVTVPSQAIQSGQDGTFVFLVKPDQRVEVRPVVAGQRLGEDTVVERGVTPGDTVVTEGTLRLVPGARVQVRTPNGGPGGGGGNGPGGRRGGGKRS